MSVTCCLFALAALVSTAFSIPIETQASDDMNHLEEKRPKYMDTRDLDFFKDLVMVSLQKLAQENKISKIVLSTEEEASNDNNDETVDKRDRHLRLCLRRSGGNYVPYPCWRGG